MNWLLLLTVTRLAIDVGSSATKYEVAEVDEGQIKTVLVDRGEPLAIEEDIKQSGTEIITDGMRHKLVIFIEAIKKDALDHKATEYSAVATSAFRKAKNAGSTLDRVAKETGIHIEIIPERNEAILGFEGAAANLKLPRNQLVVWDLGGGTMELIARDPSGKYLIDVAPTGSVGFRAEVVRKIKNENAAVILTANPMSRKQIDAAIVLAADQAKTTDSALAAKLSASGTKTVAIGALAFLQIPEKKPSIYTLDELKEALYAKADKTDKELGASPFVGQSITDLALTVGYMETLGIPSIYLKDISLTTGLLISPDDQQALSEK